MNVAALRRCVGDVDLYFAKHWAEAPLLRRADGTDFDDLASFEDLDRMVSSLGLGTSSVRMVKDGQTLSPKTYTVQSAGGRGRGEDRVSAPLVYERYAEGATIVLESLHKFWPPVTDFCRDLELALGHRLQVNAYITPPGSQGFDVHRDDHDVFVLQIWGEKHWSIFDREDDGMGIIDEPLSRGGCLYIPKGFPHSARTGRDSSAHLTVGVLTHESIDVLKEILKLAEDEPLFKRRLDLAAMSDARDLRATAQEGVEELSLWLRQIDIDELTSRLARRFKTTSQPLLRGQLSQLETLPSVDADSIVQRRPGATCFLLRREAHLLAVLPDRELQMPLEAEEAMHQVAGAERFQVSELHRSLDPQGALVLVRRLIREGLLEVVFAG